ncbi:MAG: hypothetical protein MJ106_00140 [Lentisphaeria bacterium]|nr:hypothetical protein [Lentisphaeria bacterium]
MPRIQGSTLTLFSAILTAVLALSCQRFSPSAELDSLLESRNRPQYARLEQEARTRALEAQVRKRFKLIRELIDAKSYDKADEVLATLDALTEFKEEISNLKRLNSLARNMGINETALAINHQRALNEAADLQLIPDTYDTTINITPDLEPEFIPKGPLEEMLNKKISLKVENMQLSALATQLQELDELNIADSLNIIFSDAAVKDKTFTCNFRNVPLYEIFGYISKNLGVSFSVSDHLIWVTPAAPTSGYHLETRIIHLRHGTVPKVPEGIGVSDKTEFASTPEEDTDLSSALTAFYASCPTGDSYSYYPNRNLIIVTDTRDRLRELEKIIHELDKPPLQVVVETRFIAISESDLRDVGVEIKKANGGRPGPSITPDHQINDNISNFFSELGAIKTENPEGVAATVISGIIGNRSYDMLISAIENKSSSVIVSAPRVTVLNNRTARIRKGDKLYYFEEYNIQSINQGDKGTNQVLVPRGKPTALQTGIAVDAKVNIGNDMQTIHLALKPEIITFLDWEDYTSTQSTTANNVTTNYVTNVKLPRTNHQSVSTSLNLMSGSTVIMGGMVENSKTTTIKRVPFLGSLPLIGFLFRHTETRETPTNLLIFVTATIINEKGEYVICTPPPVVTPDDLIPLEPLQSDDEN